jgi:hypothetical protein
MRSSDSWTLRPSLQALVKTRFDQLRLCQLRAMHGGKPLVQSQPHVPTAGRGAAVTPQVELTLRSG